MPGTVTSRTTVRLADSPDPSASQPLARGLKEAARAVGVSKYTLVREIKRGRLRAARIARRVVVPVEALKELLAVRGGKSEGQR